MSPHLTGLVAGFATALSVVAIAAAAGRTSDDLPARPAPRQRTAGWLAAHRRAVAAVAVAVAVLATTRIVAVAVGAGMVLWLTPTMVASYRRRLAEQAMLEAVHLWLLQLRTVLAAGSGLEQALTEVASLQPDHSPLAEPAERMAVRIDRLGPVRALQAFAGEVDNHIADAAVALLVNAFVRQSVGVADALDALVVWAEQDVRQRRDIDARLQAVRTERWMVLVIFVAIAGYFTLANRTLIAVYTTAIGQLVLAAVLAVSGLCLWSLDRMARPHRPPRFFARQEVS